MISEIVRVIPVHGALHWTLDSPGPGARHAPVHGAAPGHGVRLGDEDEGRLLQERDPDAGLKMLRNNGHYGRRQKRAENASFFPYFEQHLAACPDVELLRDAGRRHVAVVWPHDVLDHKPALRAPGANLSPGYI